MTKRKEKTMEKKLMLVEVPHEWNVKQLKEYQKYFGENLKRMGFDFDVITVPGAVTILEPAKK